MEHPLIDLVNISKTFDDTLVLDDLNLAVWLRQNHHLKDHRRI